MIELASGRMYDPETGILEIEEIASSLSKMCRFTGHTRYFYSVAEHSVIVSLLMQELKLGDPREGLLHDAVEAAVGDMASPWKRPLNWAAHEKPLDAKYRLSVGLPAEKTTGCALADELAGFIEAQLLMPSCGEHWPDERGLRDKALDLIDKGWRTLNLYPPEAEAAFLKRYGELTK